MTTEASFPKDATGQILNRAVGLPVLSDTAALGVSGKWVDLFDLSGEGDRVFVGFMIYNPDATNDISIAMGDNFAGDSQKCIRIQKGGSLSFDEMSFGPGIEDEVTGTRAIKIRAKLSGNVGTAATGTIDYSGGGTPIKPTEGQQVTINGRVYTFTAGGGAQNYPGTTLVSIGATANTAWTNLKNVLNDTTYSTGQGEQAVTASINTGTQIVTLTSNYGGTYGNLLTFADGGVAAANPTGATFSGATFAGGVGTGTIPFVHIW